MSGTVERVSSEDSRGEEKTAFPADEKSAVPALESDNEAGQEHGHLQELEVDMNLILKEEGEEDFEGDQSPYPEGMFAFHKFKHKCKLIFDFSSGSGPRCR